MFSRLLKPNTMKNTLLLAILLLLGGLVFAQGDVVVVHSHGTVSYYPPGQKDAKRVYPGMRMSIQGSVRCQAGGSVKILYNAKTLTLSDGKLYSLTELDKQMTTSQGIGFGARFWSFMMGSMQQTKDSKTLEENHRRYMESVYAGIKGFSQAEYAIQAGRLYAGKFGTELVTFRWSGMPTGQALRFRIMQGEYVVISAQVRDSLLTIDLGQLALEPDVIYQWQVRASDDTATSPRSAITPFLYDPVGQAAVLEKLYKDHEYQHALPIEQALMRAFAYEDAGFLYAASEVYTSATDTWPKDVFLRDAHAAFLARMDFLPNARARLEENLQDTEN